MFRNQVNSGSLNPGIEEKIHIGKIPYFFLVLNKKLPYYRIVIVGIIICEIIKGDTRLEKQGFAKHFLGKVQGVPSQKLGHIKNRIRLIHLLIQNRVV